MIVILQTVFIALPAPTLGAGTVAADSLPPIVSGPYRIQVSDVLQISFFKTTELNQTPTVGPDGEIFLPLVGRVEVLNRTVEEVTRELMERYTKEMVDPQITVSVSHYSGLLVYVGGEVNAPGMRSYRGGLTLVQAILDAGGFATTARRKEVLLIRKSSDNTPAGTIIDVKEILERSRFESDVLLAPSDVIFVPRKRISNVNLFIEQFIANNIPVNVFLGYSFNAD